MTHRKLPFKRTTLASALIAATALNSAAAVAQSLVLEEVIVTAQKRAESVQDISATVNVITGDSIDEFSAFNFKELETQTAGLSLISPNARNATIALRGIGVDPEAGTAGAVDTYWNDQTVRAEVAFSQLYDLERLEVLRGPQGTLQGRTSPAGAIRIITTRPNMAETEGYVQLSASDNDGFNAQAAYSMPLIENKLAVRVAGVYDQNDVLGVENINTNDDSETDAHSTRMTISWNATDTLSANFTWQNLDQDVDQPISLSGTDISGERPSLDDDDRKALGKTLSGADLEFDLLNLGIDWEVFGHDVAIVAGYVDSTKDSVTENDRAAYITDPQSLTFQNAVTDVNTYQIEARFQSQDNDFWDYMFGGYYLDQDTNTEFLANTTLRPDQGAAGFSFATDGFIPVNNKETGIFTFNQFYLSDTMTLEAGLRWSNFDRSRNATVNYAGPNYAPRPFDAIIDVISDGVEAGGGFPLEPISPENREDEDDVVTGSLTFRYELTTDTSLYAGYNRGYRPGGISIVPDPDVAFLPDGEDTLLYGEEDSDSIELGFKSRLLDGRATLNGAVYYQEFTDYLGFVRGVQVLDDNGDPADISGGIVFNGDATLWGTELEGQIRLTESWIAGGALSYAKGEWDGAEAPCNEREPGEALGTCDIDGEALGGEPEFTATLNSEYFFALEDTEIYVRGLLKYTDERENIDASAGIGEVDDTFDSYVNVNLYAGWRSSDMSWDVSLWVKNALDEDALTQETNSDQYDLANYRTETGNPDAERGSYTQLNTIAERSFGVTARYNF